MSETSWSCLSWLCSEMATPWTSALQCPCDSEETTLTGDVLSATRVLTVTREVTSVTQFMSRCYADCILTSFICLNRLLGPFYDAPYYGMVHILIMNEN